MPPRRKREPRPSSDADAAALLAVRDPRAQRRCACNTAEACVLCQFCIERHCVCAATDTAAPPKRLRESCRESRACDCALRGDGASRCELCLGCRQANPDALSHCRCLQHEQQARNRRGRRATVPSDESRCMCFSLALQKDAIDGQDAERAESYRQHRRRRLLKVKRNAGLLSADNVFDRKLRVQTASAGRHNREGDGENDDDELVHEDGEDDDDMQLHPEADEVLSVVHPSLKPEFHNWMLDYGYSTTTRWQTATTYLESIEPIPADPYASLRGTPARFLMSEDVLMRTLENAAFAQDRSEAMPSHELVDFLMFASSVKASHLPELLGSFDDSAAVALGIVIEEYARQLVQDHVVTPQASLDTMARLCGDSGPMLTEYPAALWGTATAPSAQLFAGTALEGVDWSVIHELSAEMSEDAVVETLTKRIAKDYLSVPGLGRTEATSSMVPVAPLHLIGHVESWTREIVKREHAASLAAVQAVPRAAKKRKRSMPGDTSALKISAHASGITGGAVYRYELSRDVAKQYRATIGADGFVSRADVEQAIARTSRTLATENDRIVRQQRQAIEAAQRAEEERIKDSLDIRNPVISELYMELRNQVKEYRGSLPDGNTIYDPNDPVVAELYDQLRGQVNKYKARQAGELDSDDDSDDAAGSSRQPVDGITAELLEQLRQQVAEYKATRKPKKRRRRLPKNAWLFNQITKENPNASTNEDAGSGTGTGTDTDSAVEVIDAESNSDSDAERGAGSTIDPGSETASDSVDDDDGSSNVDENSDFSEDSDVDEGDVDAVSNAIAVSGEGSADGSEDDGEQESDVFEEESDEELEAADAVGETKTEAEEPRDVPQESARPRRRSARLRS